MAKVEEMTVEVKTKLDVSRNTAEACLKLVEIYCNNNNVDILGRKNEDGTETFSFDDEKIRTEEYIRGYNQGTIDRAEEIQKCREYGYNKAIDEFTEKLMHTIHNVPSKVIGGGNVLKIAEQMKRGVDNGKDFN